MDQVSKSRKLKPIEEAMRMIKDGDRVMVSGFGNSGDPKMLVEALTKVNAKDLTIISNDLGSPNEGLGSLLTAGKIKGLIGNYYNWNPDVADAFNAGKITVDLIPQGSFAEGIRAAGVGIAGFYTKTAVGTDLQGDREIREFNGETYLLQNAIPADVALISAYKADELGNLVYYKTARNFNPLMAMAGKLVIAEVAEIVPIGSLDPESIVTPHIFVDVIVKRGC
ncbi:MAG: CoA transferase subunit A [Clostridiales bacterium]|jgi:3-oxoacid CoA-transferase A subunit|nr:CoA transferase subunit A [Clostridiales bacterium]